MLIRDKDKESLIELFRETLTGTYEIWAYGSRVNGTAHGGSELNLVIRALDQKKVKSAELNLLAGKIQESSIPILVSIKDWTKLPENLHDEVLHSHEVFHSVPLN